MTWAPFPTVSHTVTQAEIDAYGALSGDYNPLHFDADFAVASGFPAVIAHGPIGLQTAFEAVTSWLRVEQLPPAVLIDVAFRAPVRLGDTVTCAAGSIEAHAGDVLVRAGCRNQDGDLVLEVLVVVPRALAPRTR
jgi:acyl dehydratase